ncbi:MAG: hypothetical protein JNL57_08525 [Bacteroidetes bacterium]|nr:hypothetical protein [Bacteroidota bacterium]
MKIRILFLSMLAFAGQLGAETTKKGMRLPCRIVTQYGIRPLEDVATDKALWSVGMKKKKVKEVMASSGASAVPTAWSDYDNRLANGVNFKFYKMYAIAHYSSNGNEAYLVEVPATENATLPMGLRPAKTFYALITGSYLNLDRMYNSTTDGVPDQYYAPTDFYPGKMVDCRILSHEAIQVDFDLEGVNEWRKYVDDWTQSQMVDYSKSYNWPSILADDDRRALFAEYFPYYSCYTEAKFSVAGTTYYIVRISADNNYSMPSDMVPYDDDIFMVVSEDGLDLTRGYNEDLDGSPYDLTNPEEEEEETEEAPDVSPGDKLDCRIVDRGDLHSTPNLENEREALSEFFGDSELEQVIEYSTEANWPEGINTLGERGDNDDYFKYYTTHAVAKLSSDNLYILEITPEDNQHMPLEMRPDQTIYFVIGAGGVKFDRCYDPEEDGEVYSDKVAPAKEETVPARPKGDVKRPIPTIEKKNDERKK